MAEPPRGVARPYVPIGAGLLPLAVEAIGVMRGGCVLLDAITHTFHSGPPSVIMGPNGAGKSLLLRVLHGLVVPTSGRIIWGQGVDPDVAGRRSAMVFQRPTLLRRSVLANIEFVLAHRPRAAQRQSAQAILDQAGLGPRAHVQARSLSGGEQQRLALARALASYPEVLFLDEPTASLDPASTLAVETMIAAAARGGTKIILVTHDIGQARRLAGSITFLNRGRIEETGEAAAFFAMPRSAAARAYLAGELVI